MGTWDDAINLRRQYVASLVGQLVQEETTPFGHLIVPRAPALVISTSADGMMLEVEGWGEMAPFRVKPMLPVVPVPLIIYHGACRDGWCAAWVVWHFGHTQAEFVPGFYGMPPPGTQDRDVIMLDFSYPQETMEAVAATAKSLLVLEHHKSAEWLATQPYALFDLQRSGAGLAWDHFAKSEGFLRPWLVDYVEDRDLWRHELPDTQALNAYIATLEFDFNVWEDACTLDETECILRGRTALAKTQQYVREVRKNARMVSFEGFTIPLVNAPQCDISELLDSLITEDVLFSMGWWQRADGIFVYSLRSRKDFDVMQLAKRYGGGGHVNAAGFQLDAMLTL